MPFDYFVVELSENLSANENVVASIAKSFKLDERRARILLSKAPGPVTKPVIRGEAELIAQHFRDAGARVLVKKVETEIIEDNNLSTPRVKKVAKELVGERKASTSVSVHSRNLLKETGEWRDTNVIEEAKDIISRRLFFSALLSLIGFTGLGLVLFLIGSQNGGFNFSVANLWQEYRILLAASFSALFVGLPILIYYLKKYYETP